MTQPRKLRSAPLILVAAAVAVLLLRPWLFCQTPVPEATGPLPLAAISTLDFDRTGSVTVYQPSQIFSVAIFLSGTGGWSASMDGFARKLAGEGALVLGVDTRRYQAVAAKLVEPCRSDAVNLQMLSQFAQQQLGLADYREPVVTGYGAGAATAYIAAAQSPASFRGLVTLGFSPEIHSRKPFCPAGGVRPLALTDSSGWRFEPAPLPVPWIALQGSSDPAIAAASTPLSVPETGIARLTGPGGVGESIAEERWWAPFIGAYRQVAGRPSREKVASAGELPEAVADLPLVEVRGGHMPPGDAFAVFISGDGGWSDLDQTVSALLADRGLPVVGWNALKYFWTSRSPEEAAQDLARVIKTYSSIWGKTRVVLIGYSFGADVVPFMANRLPEEERQRISGIALISVSTDAVFQFTVSAWLGGGAGGEPTAPEILRLDPARTLCIYGLKDETSVCPRLPPGRVRMLSLPGGHHLGGAYGNVIVPILRLATPEATSPSPEGAAPAAVPAMPR